MHHNLLFRLSSFFIDREVERTQSAFNNELSVVLSNNKFLLNSGKANYSFGNLHTAFQEAFSKTKLKSTDFNNALLLGFGGGSIAHILRNEMKSNCSITGVEIDAEIIKLSRNYFHLNELKNCEIIIDDASHFLENSIDKFDLIAVDLFSEIDVPSAFQTDLFLTQIRKHAAKSAFIYFNFVVDNVQQKKQFSVFEKLFNETFPNSKTLILMESNRILFSHIHFS